MKTWAKITLVLVLALGVGILGRIYFRATERSQPENKPPAITARPAPPAPPAPAEPAPKQTFATMAPQDRRAFLTEIRKLAPPAIFSEMLRTGQVDHDRGKQLALQTALAYALREQPPDEAFMGQIEEYVRNPANGSFERELVVGAVAASDTPDSIGRLLKLATGTQDADLKRSVLLGIKSGGGERRREDIAPLLESAWQGSDDAEVFAGGIPCHGSGRRAA